MIAPILAFLPLSLATAAHSAPLADEPLLAGFETEAEVAAMTVRRSTHVELIEGDVKQGRRAAKVTFDAVTEGGEKWPAVVLENEALVVRDFTPYDRVTFWAKNVGVTKAPLHITVWDVEGQRGSPQTRKFELEPGRWTYVAADLPRSGLDLARIGSLHFFQDVNQETYTVILDDVRLVPRFVSTAAQVAERLSEAEETARRDAVLDRVQPSIDPLRERLTELLKRGGATEAGSAEAEAVLSDLAELRQSALGLSLTVAKARAASLAGALDKEYVLVPESSMVKVMPDGEAFGGRPGEPLRIAAARGEVEGGQVIIAPRGGRLREVTFEVSDLLGAGDARLTGESLELAPVGYVHTDPEVPPSYPVDRLGWFPDPILPFLRSFDVPGDRVQSLWLNVTVPRDQRAGVYRGEIRVSPANAEAQACPVHVRVFDFEVPRERSLRTAIATFESHWPRIYGERWDRDMYWRYVDFLHAHRINIDHIYRGHSDPPALEDVKRMLAGGQDGWCLRYIVQPGSGGSGSGVDPAKFEEYVTEAIADSVRAYEVFKAAGAEEICYVYFFDEVGPQHYETLKTAAARLREALPGVPLLTTARDPDYGIASGVSEVIDVWVPLTPSFGTEEGRAAITRARANGDEVWWYVCIGPRRPYANLFIEYDAVEARLLMGAMTQRYQPDGFLYYATTMWGTNDHPIEDGPYTDWNPASYRINNGDGSWFCAGPDGPLTTIRFENFRDGLEDYEYYCLLARKIQEARARGVADRRLKRAEALLEVPGELVTSLTEYTRDPGVLERQRLKLAEAIEGLAGL